MTVRFLNRRELIPKRYPIVGETARRLNEHAHDLVADGHPAASVVAFRRADALEPDNPLIVAGLGGALVECGRYQEASEVARRGCEIEPEYPPSYCLLGTALTALGRYEEAKQAYLRALDLDPEFSEARFSYGLGLFESGRWSEAWPYYEARTKRKLPYPDWKGEDLSGKTLFVQGEQGVGDRILFSRYLAWVKHQHPGARILFMHNTASSPDISNLIWSLRSIVEPVPSGILWPEADYGIFLSSIPALHGTTMDHVPPDPGLFAAELWGKDLVSLPPVDEGSVRVGVVWTGNAKMRRNRERAIPFELIMGLAELPNVVLCGLQFDSNDIADHGAEQLVCDLTPTIKPFGFNGTAAAMLKLDLVITCCTATAHLAGALGVPCWTLLCANPYWVWQRAPTDTVWYPGMRLFRQRKLFDWSAVIEQVKDQLVEFSERREAAE